ncbi:MAG: hypothetical protein U1B30_13895, partial [Pseudomonadota bacterium]|nr:hypothetical protein [Pseudomonadota bacterium]
LLPIYIVGIFIVAVLVDSSMRDAIQAVAEAKVSGIGLTATGNFKAESWLTWLGSVYRDSGNFVLLFAAVAIFIEFSACIAAAINSHTSKDSAGTGFMSYWWATVIAIIGAPLMAYSVAKIDGSSERGFIGMRSDESSSVQHWDNVSYTLSPLFALYGAPTYQLGLSGEPESPAADRFIWSPHYPSRQSISLNDFARDTFAWLILCALVALAAKQRQRKKSAAEPENIRQLLTGEPTLKEALTYGKFHYLPWRGKYFLVGTIIALVFTGLALLLQLLFYGIIAFFYGGFLVIPVIIFFFILVGIFRKFTKK